MVGICGFGLYCGQESVAKSMSKKKLSKNLFFPFVQRLTTFILKVVTMIGIWVCLVDKRV